MTCFASTQISVCWSNKLCMGFIHVETYDSYAHAIHKDIDHFVVRNFVIKKNGVN